MGTKWNSDTLDTFGTLSLDATIYLRALVSYEALKRKGMVDKFAVTELGHMAIAEFEADRNSRNVKRAFQRNMAWAVTGIDDPQHLYELLVTLKKRSIAMFVRKYRGTQIFRKLWRFLEDFDGL